MLVALFGLAAGVSAGGEPCRFPGIEEPLRCTTVSVPENRRSRTPRILTLRVAILPARDSSPARANAEPLFILVGGPGIPATYNIPFFATIFSAARNTRDLVFVEQRGTGGSNRLQCDLYSDLQSYLGALFSGAGAEHCAAQLGARADLRLYSTPIAMDDLDDVRSALGYDRINLFGTSYGTRGALIYLRRHPERVRSLILKGVMGFDLRPTRDVERSLEILVADCRADRACRAAYPRIDRQLASVLRRLDQDPVAITLSHPTTKAEGTAQFSRDTFLATMLGLLQNVGSANQALDLISQAAGGDFGPLARIAVDDHRGFEMAMSGGMALSVFCAENPDGAIGPDLLEPACEAWPKSESLADRRPVWSEVPVLLISGHLDPITPPAGAAVVAKNLPNGRHLVVRYGSHSYTGLSPCLDGIMARFLENTSVKDLDASCLDRIRRPPFGRPRS